MSPTLLLVLRWLAVPPAFIALFGGLSIVCVILNNFPVAPKEAGVRVFEVSRLISIPLWWWITYSVAGFASTCGPAYLVPPRHRRFVAAILFILSSLWTFLATYRLWGEYNLRQAFGFIPLLTGAYFAILHLEQAWQNSQPRPISPLERILEERQDRLN